MSNQMDKGVSRRDLLKKAALGALALSAGPTILIPRRARAYEPAGKVHPYISPLRVVGARDPGMVNGTSVGTGWDVHDPMVAAEKVSENMDRMAMALAQEGSAADAWKKIFLKPAGKGWGDVVVAVKSNQIAQQRSRSAVMSKLCHVLTDQMGVKPANIVIYDAKHGGSMQGNVWKGLPEGVNLAGTWGGINLQTTVQTAMGPIRTECVGHLVKGEVDILVNVGLCKGHNAEFGGFTMCMKNHFGTFNPGPGHDGRTGGANYILGINRTPEVLGQLDPATGNVLFPRTQLNVVDALWGSQSGPGGLPSAQMNALLMGTFAPAVDYVGALRLRRDLMHWRVNEQVTAEIAKECGFTDAELPNGGQIIDALGAT
jgi:hypothetical protein